MNTSELDDLAHEAAMRGPRRAKRGKWSERARRVTRVALGSTALATAVFLSPAQPFEPETAHAEDCLSKVIPGDALDGAVLQTGATGAFAVGTSSLVSGGATLATATAGASAAIAAGTLIGTVAATCKFLDWLTRDGDALPIPATLPTSQFTPTGTVGACTYSGGDYGDPANNRCTHVSWPAGSFSAGQWVWNTQDASRSWHSGALTMPRVTSNKLYPATVLAQRRGAHWTAYGNPTFSCHTESGLVPSTGSTCLAANTNTTLELFFPTCGTANVGGFCELNPGTTYYLTNTNAASGTVQGVWHPFPDLRDKGWYRVIHTDVLCRNLGASSGGTWVRATSAPYRDREVSSRANVPTCSTGQVPMETIVRRAPLNTTCALGVLAGSGHCVADNILTRVQIPSSLVATATAPAWSACLAVGTDCGAPVLSGGVCTWGGHTVAVSFCDPELQAGNPVTNPQTIPQATGVVEPEPYTAGQPASTAGQPAPPGGGDPGVTINVPIDDGEGDRDGVYPGEDGTEDCWPSGWGWLNPAEWVLRPIKCALLWAFVPSDGFFAGLIGTDGPEEAPVELDDESFFYPVQILLELGNILGDEIIVSDGDVSAGNCGIALPFAGLQADGTGATGSTEVMGMTSVGANVCDGAGMTTTVQAARALSLVGTALGALWMASKWLRRESGLGLTKASV